MVIYSHMEKELRVLYQNDFDNKTKQEYFDFCISILNVISLFIKKQHSLIWHVSYNAKSRDDYGKIIFSELNPFTVKETILVLRVSNLTAKPGAPSTIFASRLTHCMARKFGI